MLTRGSCVARSLPSALGLIYNLPGPLEPSILLPSSRGKRAEEQSVRAEGTLSSRRCR